MNRKKYFAITIMDVDGNEFEFISPLSIPNKTQLSDAQGKAFEVTMSYGVDFTPDISGINDIIEHNFALFPIDNDLLNQ